MAEDEVEITNTGRDDYEVIPITPIRSLERRLSEMEKAGSIPQLQTLIIQIVELIKSNQKIVNEVISANADLRNEMSKLPGKLDELTTTMKHFLSLVEAAGRDEISAPGPEAFRPLTEQLQKLVDQQQKVIDSNRAIQESIDGMSKKMKAGTPVSQLLSSYPGMRLKREV